MSTTSPKTPTIQVRSPPAADRLNTAEPPPLVDFAANLQHIDPDSPDLQPLKLYDTRAALLTHAINSARDNFLLFVKLINPEFRISAHHRVIAHYLQLLDSGVIRRLMIFMPPRSSKSMLASQYFPAWSLGRHPVSWQILSISHKIEQAAKFGRDVRDIVASPTYQAIFPTLRLSPDVRAADHWKLSSGATYIAAGTTSRIAGKGANIGLIDDPLSEQDAYSKAERDRVIQWYPGGFRSRLQPGGRIGLITTRWHDNDLAGYLLEESRNNPESDKWHIIKIPAILDKEGSALLNLPEGGSYWPPASEADIEAAIKQGIHTGWPLPELLSTKANMPPYQWEALYMQRPTPEGGSILKTTDWQKWEAPDPPYCTYKFLSVDTAFSTKDSADYSAIVTWGIFYDKRDTPCLIMLGARKGRWEFSELTSKVTSLHQRHDSDCILIEKKASGQSLIQELQRAGLPVRAYSPDRDKISRANAAATYFHAERVYVPTQRKWAEDVIYECGAFPSGAHDDFVDCTTQAVLWVAQGNWLQHPERALLQQDDPDTLEKSFKEYSY